MLVAVLAGVVPRQAGVAPALGTDTLDIDAAGTWIKEDGIKFEVNSYDLYALEEALRIKDAGEADVLARVDQFPINVVGASNMATPSRVPANLSGSIQVT